ncbi:glycosyltransferase family 2 protein [Arthrobacter sp. MI7-26]|uniref:glycosyltransferase family 2 protein n=1 Tax=Arthrobacter sp. MI7-26 TaxID=2993653 RepID=UPI002249498D|nr:glycosyltransferase family 2 protein [Arthrobacter sp. MI7-26]MCX2747683.1 glycosyltransferase family 2 protein [Arthrobacter sp. MI7-26]
MIVLSIFLVLGVGTIFWSVAGLLRLATEQSWRAQVWSNRIRGWISLLLGGGAPTPQRRRARHRSNGVRIYPSNVAVLVAAHNEAIVINETILAASALVPRRNIHIISDMSTDDTAAIARAAGVKVLELEPNRGKAGALAAGIAHFDLCKRFKVVMLLDADTRPAPDYLETGLPLFSDPTVVAVAGRAKSIMSPPSPTAIGRLLVAYRERLYIVVQLLLKYGQAARGANVVSIVPGFASMYRTSALTKIEVLAPGLVIEDFNMTFEIHAKKLGRIAFHPSAAVAYTQDPDNLKDYIKQVRRWILGFWQTVRRHGLQVGRFWFVLGLYIVELVASCIFFVLLVPAFLLSSIAAVEVWIFGNRSEVFVFLSGVLRPQDVLIGVFLPDFFLTVLAAVSMRSPRFLLMAPLFPLMRILDAVICLQVLPRAYSSRSSGVWVSPVRRIQRPSREVSEAGPSVARVG